MKTKLLAFTLHAIFFLVGRHAALGDGAVDFRNRAGGSPAGFAVYAPVYGVNPADPFTRLSGNATTNGGTVDYTGAPLLFGSGFTASLWAAPDENYLGASDFQFIASTVFRTNLQLGGIWLPVTPAPFVPWVTENGTQVYLQVRVWDNLGGTVQSWADAVANPLVATGYSDPILYAPAVPPFIPEPMRGLTSFNLTLVPEPSFFALGALGAVAGLIAWRRGRRRNTGVSRQ